MSAATLSEATLPVRRLRFVLPAPADFHPLTIGGNSALSYTHTAMGLYVEALEPFLVKAMRRVLPRVRDAALAESVDRFCRQEAQHYQQHVAFNRLIVGHGYPGLEARIQALKAETERWLERDGNAGDAFRIGFAVGFEAYATQSGLHALKVGWYDNGYTLEPWASLFKWHMVEEIEHRAVAHELFEHLWGDGAGQRWRGWARRARMCWFAQRHIHRFIFDTANLMSAADVPRHGPRCRITAKARVSMALLPLAMRLNSMRPGWSPQALHVPDYVGHFGQQFSQRAEALG
jgi:uncharacterized protein